MSFASSIMFMRAVVKFRDQYDYTPVAVTT